MQYTRLLQAYNRYTAHRAPHDFVITSEVIPEAILCEKCCFNMGPVLSGLRAMDVCYVAPAHRRQATFRPIFSQNELPAL
jgi:hypothetical protein